VGERENAFPRWTKISTKVTVRGPRVVDAIAVTATSEAEVPIRYRLFGMARTRGE
jgi:hypothetical protein